MSSFFGTLWSDTHAQAGEGSSLQEGGGGGGKKKEEKREVRGREGNWKQEM